MSFPGILFLNFQAGGRCWPVGSQSWAGLNCSCQWPPSLPCGVIGRSQAEPREEGGGQGRRTTTKGSRERQCGKLLETKQERRKGHRGHLTQAYFISTSIQVWKFPQKWPTCWKSRLANPVLFLSLEAALLVSLGSKLRWAKK